MALIKCSECGKEISDKAQTCPHCGCPVSIEDTKKIEQPAMEEKCVDASKVVIPDAPKKKSKKPIIVIGAVVFIILIAGVYYFATTDQRNYKEANTYYENEDFESALEIYKNLGDYKDSKELVEKCEYEMSVDRQFIRTLSKSLITRWDIDELDENDEIKNEDTLYAEYCDSELNMLSEFYDKEFNDDELGKLAKEYIDLLNEAKDSLKYYTVDYNKHYNEWRRVYAERTIILKTLVNDYGLTVDEEHKNTLEDIMKDADGAEEQFKMRQQIQDMMENFEVESQTDEWNYTTYSISMKNTTDYEFEYFYVDVNVLDKNNDILDTGTSEQVSSWKKGQKVSLDIYFNDELKSKEIKGYEFTAHYESGDFYE